MGPPGVGKGTQAQYFVSKKSFKHISTGDLFRRALKEKTPLGKEAQEYLDVGKLVPDKVTIGLVDEVVQATDSKHPVLFDGFPRTLVQAEALDKILKIKNQKIDLVISLLLSYSVILDRLTGRRLAPQSGRVYHIRSQPPKKEGFCDETGETLIVRKDDQEDVVKKRLHVFEKQNKILRGYYEPKGLLHEISAEASPEQVFFKILPLLER